MTRLHLAFPCAGSTCLGTLDLAPGATGLLIVSGGNELRAGAWNGQAALAAVIAAQGFPVFRFDRRGVGDSEGRNTGFLGSEPDLRAAAVAFRAAAPGVRRIVALGNCDAAAALMLCAGAGCDALVLSNPWTIEPGAEAAAQPAALRAHYARRLRDPAAVLRLLKGRIAPRQLLISLRDMLRPQPPSSLAARMAAGLAGFAGPVRILLAGRDRTAQVFMAGWDQTDPRLHVCPEASHSFVEPAARDWLLTQVLAVLTECHD
ncbi:hydrolase 1, exosortase A system-associated [Novosphingobium piscinae]|uniref:Hydrolase 1, exosortase A system-associated n=1 Tax=Novosphingobium piscinae TaxID=1507448 RepID=A0A7X1FZ85_9SPHN|nr:hydrolase 1, exosortase A system-associated [Novosphingobium piscinae]MBC2669579.1 hydrolase 1, exosortase A system-associated [Novosphingobium piscinae]